MGDPREQWQVPTYNGSVFISYARADDEKFPFDDNALGWVSFFWKYLRWALTDNGLHQAGLWLDRYQIEPAEDFTEAIEAALKEARLIVPILSPNWVQRSWCQRELERFCELHSHVPGTNDNIAPVYKKEPPISDIPAVLRNREGYRFFARISTGEVQEFYWDGLKDKQAYAHEVKRLADWIYIKLIQSPPPTPMATPRNGRTLFVAAAADELRDARQRLVNDLVGAGYTVVPSDDRLPDTLAAAEAVVRDALSAAELTVHVLGDNEGFTPGGGSEPIVPLQLRLARERAVQGGSQARVLWAPKWLPGRKDAKRDPFTVVARYGERQPGEEIYAEEVTDLSQWLRGRIECRKQADPAAERCVLVASAAAADDDLISTLAGRLQGSGMRMQGLFAGDSLTIDPTIISAALVPWGEAGRAELDALLTALQPLGAKVTVLRLPGGDEPAKRRFFPETVAFEKLDALPADRKATRALLARLVSNDEHD